MLILYRGIMKFLGIVFGGVAAVFPDELDWYSTTGVRWGKTARDSLTGQETSQEISGLSHVILTMTICGRCRCTQP
jgi:hypothetical protein